MRLSPKILKFFMEDSLIVIFIWTQFQIEISKYGLTSTVGFYSENVLKTLVLPRNKPWARTFFVTVNTTQQALQNAQSPASKAN
jgi:hypothetical protein